MQAVDMEVLKLELPFLHSLLNLPVSRITLKIFFRRAANLRLQAKRVLELD